MIRAATPDDSLGILEVATATGLFEPEQVNELAEMLDRHFGADASSELWLTDEHDAKTVGVAYVAPEKMTDGTWNLYLIAVHPEHQRQGRGKALLQHVEGLLTTNGARVLLIETAGVDEFDYVRALYAKSGYTEEARIREFYEAGVDKVVYRKELHAAR